MPKLKSRHLWRAVVLGWAACLVLWYLVGNVQMEKLPVNRGKLLEVFAELHHRNSNMSTISTHSTVYDELFGQTSIYDFLLSHSLQERCTVYFQHLPASNPEWLFNPSEAEAFQKLALEDFNRFKNLYNEKWDRTAEEAEKTGTEPPPKLTDSQLHDEHELFRQRFVVHEQSLHDTVAHVRIFNKCFLDTKNDGKFVKTQQKFLTSSVEYEYGDGERGTDKSQQKEVKSGAHDKKSQLIPPESGAHDKKSQLIPPESGEIDKKSQLIPPETGCEQVQTRLFPFLTNEYPEYVRWNGDKSQFPGNEKPLSACFLDDFKKRANGKGIVMTLKDDHVGDAARLIRVLRFFRNSFPIQVVYHTELSSKSRNKLVEAARNDFQNLPRQELWFVNAERSIKRSHARKFDAFANKIVATMFNSFEHMLLVDADAVVFKNIEYFFTLKRYVQTGTFFYKDRYLIAHRNQNDNDVFRRLLPSVEDSAVFNIPQTSNHTLANEFFQYASTHYMESGVVVLNKKRHFLTPFTMAILIFHDVVTSQLYGDKELFWLSCAVLGADYAVNSHFAASSGELTPVHERQKEFGHAKRFHSQEICSNHPSHLSDADNSLVWINSGIRFCGNSQKPTWNFQKEFDGGSRFTHLHTVEEFKVFFESKMKITHAIVPPYYGDHTRAKNAENEPETPWKMASYCKNYCWCAYSSIGGEYLDESGEKRTNRLEGKVVTFSRKDQKLFGAVADVWMAPLEEIGQV